MTKGLNTLCLGSVCFSGEERKPELSIADLIDSAEEADLIPKTKRSFWKALNRTVAFGGDALVIPWKVVNSYAGTQLEGPHRNRR